MASTPIKRRGTASMGSPSFRGTPVRTPSAIARDNNDAKEIAGRRRSHLAELNMQSPYRASPLRKSSRDAPATQKLSNDQLSALISATIEGQVKRKINTKTAFQWNLIDYLNDICTTKEADMPSFSTLANVIDASGEIYASKVDHLMEDTIKVRTDLVRTSAGKKPTEADGEGEGEEGATGKKKKAGRYSGNTIVKNISQITASKLDLGFSVDPLFSKTSAAFDQGGARGLLMNHLSSQGQSELKFDSSESIDSVVLKPPTASTPVDVGVLLDTVTFVRDKTPAPSICPQFSTFKFLGWTPNAGSDSIDDAEPGPSAESVAMPMTINTEYDAAAAVDDDDDLAFDQSFADYDDPMPDDNDMTGDMVSVDQSEEQTTVGSRARTRAKLVLLQDNEFGWLEGKCGGANGWHGEADFAVLRPKGAKKDAAKRVKKPKFQVEFNLDQDWKSLLGKSRAATTLAKYTVESHTLPDDLHLTAQTFTKHFLLPARTVKMVSREYGDDEDDGHVDLDGDDFQTAATFGNDDYIPAETDSQGLGPSDSPVPLFDDDGFSGDDDVAPPSPGELGSQIPTTAAGEIKLIADVKRVNKIEIGYAQKAKVVDVKRLKQTLWSEIESSTEVGKTSDVGKVAAAVPADSKECTSFNKLVSDIPQKVNTKMADSLSVPIMFVCLLYLANDKELQIQGVESMDDLVIKQKALA